MPGLDVLPARDRRSRLPRFYKTTSQSESTDPECGHHDETAQGEERSSILDNLGHDDLLFLLCSLYVLFSFYRQLRESDACSEGESRVNGTAKQPISTGWGGE